MLQLESSTSRVIAGITVALLSIPGAGAASPKWSSGGIRVAPSPAAQRDPAIVSDDAGGAFVFWLDQRGGTFKTYVQHLGPTGRQSIGWPEEGRAFPESPTYQDGRVVALRDGHGGAFVAAEADWYDPIAIGRITASGAAAAGWPAGGLTLRSEIAPSEPESPEGIDFHKFAAIDRGEDGGARLAWIQGTRTSDMTWFSTVTEDGTKSTPVNLGYGIGIPVSLCADGAGGAYVAHDDYGLGVLVMHLIHQAPDPVWPAGGLVVAAEPSQRRACVVVADGVGSVYVIWQSARENGDHTWMQHLLADGSVASGWPTEGLPLSIGVSEAAGTMDPLAFEPFPAGVAAADGEGGLYVAWTDMRGLASGDSGDVYLQRVTSDGAPAPGWPSEGLAIASGSGRQAGASISVDADHGVWVAWRSLDGADRVEIHATHVDANGRASIGSRAGDDLGTAPTDQWPVIVALDDGSAILAWSDDRGETPAIYAQRVTSKSSFTSVGVDPTGAASLRLEPVAPNPVRGRMTIEYALSSRAAASIDLIDISGRRVLSRLVSGGGPSSIALDASGLRAGVYVLRLEQSGRVLSRRVTVVH